VVDIWRIGKRILRVIFQEKTNTPLPLTKAFDTPLACGIISPPDPLAQLAEQLTLNQGRKCAYRIYGSIVSVASTYSGKN